MQDAPPKKSDTPKLPTWEEVRELLDRIQTHAEAVHPDQDKAAAGRAALLDYCRAVEGGTVDTAAIEVFVEVWRDAVQAIDDRADEQEAAHKSLSVAVPLFARSIAPALLSGAIDTWPTEGDRPFVVDRVEADGTEIGHMNTALALLFAMDHLQFLDLLLLLKLRRDERNQGLPDIQQRLPQKMAQPTFAEVKTTQWGLADGPFRRNWTAADDGQIAVHQIPTQPGGKKWPLQTKFDPADVPQKWSIYQPSGDSDKDTEALFELLKHTGIDAALLMNCAVAYAILKPKSYVSLDAFVRASGEDPRGPEQWKAARERAWLRLKIITAMAPVGQRIGRYKDPHTGEVLDLRIDDPLLRVVSTIEPEQGALDSTTPKAIALDGGVWIERYRGNPKVLTFFGNVMAVASIPNGRPSGCWARCIGMNLQQAWREDAKEATVTRRQGKRDCVTGSWTFTRRKLLGDMAAVPPLYHYQTFLDSKDPGRARKVWTEAIQLLQEREVISRYEEEASPDVNKRKGWAEAWLNQPLRIAPGQGMANNLRELATKQKNAQKALAQARRRRADRAQ